MNVPAAFVVGSASHTGHIRLNNEDDYLLGSLLPPRDELLLCAVADGMGGTMGGAEASRTALRALASTVLDGNTDVALAQRLQQGFAAAAARVSEQAAAVPALCDMGTTLTVLCLSPGQAIVGHVGDSRLYRVRSGQVQALTIDHAVQSPENLLTRCIGGGQSECNPDFATFATRIGERYVLLSDGVWGVLDEGAIGRLTARETPQNAAEALVAAALQAGGPDNATAIVVEVLATTPSTASRELELEREERPGVRSIWPRPRSLRPPLWPWFALTAALLLAALAGLRWWFGWDLRAWLQGWW